MNDNEIALQKIISSYCPWSWDHIDLTATIQGHYVSSAVKDNFSDDICANWTDIDCTTLHNQMFTTLKTGEDIINFINS
jgi:hypothetical protein